MNIDLDLIDIDSNAVKAVSKEICHRFSIFPYKLNKDSIYLASFTEKAFEHIEELKFIFKMNVKLSICDKEQYMQYMAKYYEEKYRQKIAETVKKKIPSYINSWQIEINSPAVSLVESIIREGICKGASDIHIEPQENQVLVRYRVDGTLKVFSRLSINVFSGIIGRIKVLAHMDISQQFIPQDGEINFQLNNNQYDFRVSTLPTIHGEKCVLRILKREDLYNKLENIGFRKNDYEMLKNIVKFKQGLILITGPTGSGKSTTLYSLIREIDSESKNIITIENPVECQINGINQVSLGNDGSKSSRDIIKAVLRQDPDIIMVGEIRDKATAEAAINASLTGHLVFSTLHTNDSSSTIARLANMGISQDLIRDSLLMIISQRLTRCICPDCREKYELSYRERKIMDDSSLIIAYRGMGCGRCNNTGYKGRHIVYEMLPISDEVKEAMEGSDSDTIRNTAISLGMVTMDDYYKMLIKDGITTVEEYYSNMEVYNLKKILGRRHGV